MGMFDDFAKSAGYDPSLPVISPDVEATMPTGLKGFLRETDVIFGPQNQSQINAFVQNASAKDPSAGDSPYIKELQDIGSGVKGSAMVFPWDAPAEDCFVVAPDPALEKSTMTRGTGVFPGQSADWYAYTMLHENAHCRDAKEGGYADSRLQRETIADYGASRDYYKAMKEGVVSDPEVPYAWRAMRAEAVMNDGVAAEDDDYAVNAVTPLPGEPSALEKYPTLAAAREDIVGARDKILGKIEQLTGTDAPATLINEQPELAYETSRAMLDKGEFDGQPAGKKFVETFVDGAQRYNAEKYGVAPEDRPQERPRIVEDLAAKFAPSVLRAPSQDFSISLQ